VLSKVGFAKAD